MLRMMSAIVDITGHRFGLLTVSKRHFPSNKAGNALWQCRCDCGTENVIAIGIELRSGHKSSCGCLWKKTITTHGMAGTPEYRAWQKMKARCTCKTDKRYIHYGGRGIKVCSQWLNSFESFYADMGAKPAPHLTLDRANNDGDYTPENCRWATYTRQNNNKRHNPISLLNLRLHRNYRVA